MSNDSESSVESRKITGHQLTVYYGHPGHSNTCGRKFEFIRSRDGLHEILGDSTVLPGAPDDDVEAVGDVEFLLRYSFVDASTVGELGPEGDRRVYMRV